MTKPKAVIFDLGKVVFDLSFDRVFEYWALLSGKHFNEIKNQFAFDEVFEKAEISSKQFRETIMQRLEIKLSDEHFDKGWCNLYLDKYAGVDDLLTNLKSKYRIVALTNTNAIHSEVWRVKYADTLKHFEKIFSSHELGTRKPESKIFNMVLDYLNMKPEQILFLDDNIDNINSAKQIGISSILVTSYEQMNNELISISTH